MCKQVLFYAFSFLTRMLAFDPESSIDPLLTPPPFIDPLSSSIDSQGSISTALETPAPHWC